MSTIDACQHCGATTRLWVRNRFCGLECERCDGAAYNVLFTCANQCGKRDLKQAQTSAIDGEQT